MILYLASSSFCFFLKDLMLSMAFVYFIASKISSNFFFRTDGSLIGHKLSSWWQKITESKMALDTPRYWGM
ncbi:hypothetical protein BDV23DRAFT_160192, partial [Aspergillus alliaceus]